MADEDPSGSPVEYDGRIELVDDVERILRKLGMDHALENQRSYDHLVPPLIDTNK
jgi:hypothetical protein